MGKFIETFWKAIDTVMAVLMAAMIALVFINVVLRYGFHSGLRPSVELSRLGFVWVVMLGSVGVLRRGEHLAVSEFSEVLFPALVPYIRKVIWLIVLVSAGMLFWGSVQQTIANWHNISQLTGLPTGLLYLAGVISGALMAIVAVAHIFGPLEHVVRDAPVSEGEDKQ
ncbi:MULTISPECIES: TRAP transporter small permease [Tropicimonas]|uniref:TRAP transporter small permease protein n=2 Tax=Tropicimonas TaxID=599652 RepID=A0A239J025_9RHOB|nr:TRAP transporter small permease [Tropicimonas sediminicola]SNS99251.1 TRAP-type C4-dicarboxylate transport system, small permease component [Tropicimonas sediminicola]